MMEQDLHVVITDKASSCIRVERRQLHRVGTTKASSEFPSWRHRRRKMSMIGRMVHATSLPGLPELMMGKSRRITVSRVARASAWSLVMMCWLQVRLASAQSISAVSYPATLSAGEIFTVQWTFSPDDGTRSTTGDLRRFDFLLARCSDDNSVGCTCDNAVFDQSMCLRNDGCMDSDGSYELTGPYDAIATAKYLLKVVLARDRGVYDCGTPFEVVSADDDVSSNAVDDGFSSGAEDEADGRPALTVLTPEDSLWPGHAFTALWYYEKHAGNGSASGNFAVDLYSCAVGGACGDAGSCGEFVAALCPDEGCFDPGTGDYDVVVPETVEPGDFTLLVRELSENGPWDCGRLNIGLPPGSTRSPVASPTDRPQITTSPSIAAFPPDITRTPTSATEMPSPAPSTTMPSPVPVTTMPSIAPATMMPSPSPTTTMPSIAPTTEMPSTAPETMIPSPSPTTTMPSIAPTTERPSTAPETMMPSPSPTTETLSPTWVALPPFRGDPGSPGVPPAPVPPRVDCDDSVPLEFHFEETDDSMILKIRHSSGDREDHGCVTLTKIWEWMRLEPEGVPTDILSPVDPNTEAALFELSAEPTGVWLLRCSVDVRNGLTMEMKGTTAGGDCDELKISSSPSVAHRLRGYGGNLYFFRTKVTSWREDTLEPHDLGRDSDGTEMRSYVSCVSEMLEEGQTCEGHAKHDMGECRMDMVESELGYLGYWNTESYGITWKVRGFCVDLSNPEIFDKVNVYGDITDCDIHHMWYGMYSYGHEGGVWTGNLMHDNHVYGFDPHDDSDYLTIHNNVVWDNGYHGIIASKRCDHLSIRNNTVYGNGGSGIMLHRSCDDSEVIGNKVDQSTDCGIALVETSRSLVTENIFSRSKWGVRLTLGSSDNEIVENVIEESTMHDVYTYMGSVGDEPMVPPFTRINTGNTFDSNTVLFVAEVPVNIQDAEDTAITNNVFVGSVDAQFDFKDAEGTDLYGNKGDVLDAQHAVSDSCFTPRSDHEPTC